MEYYNNHLLELAPESDRSWGSMNNYGMSLTHRVITDDRLTEFRRPKIIHICANGDVYYKGFELSVTPHRYLNFQEFLSDIEKRIRPNIAMPMGVRKLYSRRGQLISSLDELQDAQIYVAAGPEHFRPLMYSKQRKSPSNKKVKKLRNMFNNKINYNRAMTYSDGKTVKNSFKPKVITVIKNSGKLGRSALRLVLNRSSLKSMQQVISSLNTYFHNDYSNSKPIYKLYTISGRAIDTIDDLLRPEDSFIGVDEDGITWKDVIQIMTDIFKDDYEKMNIHLQRWELNRDLQRPNKHNKNQLKIDKTNKKTLQRSLSLDNVKIGQQEDILPQPFNKIQDDKRKPEQTENCVIVPLGKGPVPTSHFQNVLKTEQKTRLQLERSRRALFERKHARNIRDLNEQFDYYQNMKSHQSDDDFDKPDIQFYPLPASASSRYRPMKHHNNRHDDIQNFNNPRYTLDDPYINNPNQNLQYKSLIQPQLPIDDQISYSDRRYDKNKILQFRPRRANATMNFTTYKQFTQRPSTASSSSSNEGQQIENGGENRHSKIPLLDSFAEFQQLYKFHHQIGKGRFSRVFLAYRLEKNIDNDQKTTQVEVAVKVISKAILYCREYQVNKEIDMLYNGKHDLVAHLLETYETNREIIMIMQIAEVSLKFKSNDLSGAFNSIYGN